MASLNKVMLIGNVTRDPEVKFTPKGSAVADLGLAVNRTYTNQAGEKTEEVTYIDVELWGRLAEIAGEYAKKGRSIFIEGRLRLDSWEDKQSGQKRNRLKVVGEVLQLLGSRPGGGPAGVARAWPRGAGVRAVGASLSGSLAGTPGGVPAGPPRGGSRGRAPRAAEPCRCRLRGGSSRLKAGSPWADPLCGQRTCRRRYSVLIGFRR